MAGRRAGVAIAAACGIAAAACLGVRARALDARHALADLARVVGQGSQEARSEGVFAGLAHYGRLFLAHFGVPWVVLASIAAYRAIRASSGLVAVGVLGAGYAVAASAFATHHAQYAIPSSHAGDLLAAVGAVWVAGRVRSAGARRWTWPLAVAAIAAVPLATCVAQIRHMRKPPLHGEALGWIEAHVPCGAPIVRTAWTPQVEVLGDCYRARAVGLAVDRIEPLDELQGETVFVYRLPAKGKAEDAPPESVSAVEGVSNRP